MARPRTTHGRPDLLRPAVVAAGAVLTVVGCGQQTVTARDGDSAAASTRPAGTELTVTVGTRGSAHWSWTLRCDPPGGDHPDPDAACAALGRANQPFAPVPKDMVCTEIYGGPQTATIVGTWRGALVRGDYSRVNGCEIARWDALASVLGTAAGRPGGT